jgi:hypothetical protein
MAAEVRKVAIRVFSTNFFPIFVNEYRTRGTFIRKRSGRRESGKDNKGPCPPLKKPPATISLSIRKRLRHSPKHRLPRRIKTPSFA